ncbi:MAG: replication initiation protein [Peptostreptococcaceae bacterium]|nr:replication initiation protein [Peptostreptococcaceae bacterium]
MARKNQEINIIQKHNDLVRHLKYKDIGFTVTEKKLINYFISKLDRNDIDEESFPLQVFKVVDICNLLKIKPGGFYEELREITLGINSKTFEIVKPNFDGRFIISQVNWFERIRYDLGNGRLEVKFHGDLVPYLLRLHKRGQFTSYRIGESISMKNKFSLSWYEYLLSYISIRDEIEMDIEDIREFLQIDSSKHKRDIDLINTCVRKPISEINLKSDLFIEIENIMNKNKIIAVKVKFRLKTLDEFLAQNWRMAR